jgi:hypothetical protein
MVPFESTIERDLLYFLDYSSEVLDYEAQPLVIPYEHGGKTRTYTPDFLVGMADRDLLVECKPTTLCDDVENLRKWTAAREWCADCQWQFVVITDELLRSGYVLENVKLLTQFARHSVIPQVRSRVFSLFVAAATASTASSPSTAPAVTSASIASIGTDTNEPSVGQAELPVLPYPTTISQLARRLAPSDPNSAISSIMHLVFHHKIDAPLESGPLSGDTPLWLPAYPPYDLPTPILLPQLVQFPTLP